VGNGWDLNIEKEEEIGPLSPDVADLLGGCQSRHMCEKGGALLQKKKGEYEGRMLGGPGGGEERGGERPSSD